METEDVLRLRSRLWFGGSLTALGLVLFLAALFALAAQFQDRLGVRLVDVPPNADSSMFVAAPLLTISGISCTLIGLSVLAAARNILRVREHGFLGKARVVSATPTEVYVNGRELLQLDLVVELSGLDPYSASTRAALGASEARVEPGSEVPVRVDPKDEQRILFV